MNIFIKIYSKFRFFFNLLGNIGNYLHTLLESITESKTGKFFLKYRLFSLIPILGLSVSVNNLRVVKESLIDENEKLHIENSVLKEQVLNKFMTFNDIPVYIWSKLKVGDKGYMMLRVNDYYYVGMMNPMGYKRTDYIGKYDYDIYGEKIASMFKIEDDKVAITGDTLTLMNRIDDTLRNIHKDLLITKWRRIEQNKDTFVLGQAVDITKLIEEIENNIKNNN